MDEFGDDDYDSGKIGMDDDYDGSKISMAVSRIESTSQGGQRTTDIYLSASRRGSRAPACKEESFDPSSWKEEEVLPTIEQSLSGELVVPQMDSDSDSESEEEEEEQEEQKAPEKFQGEFKWDGFSEAKELSGQNATLLTQLDAKDKEIDELHVLMRAIEPIPGLDPERFLDVMHGSEMVDQDYRDAKILDLSKKLKNSNVQLQTHKSASKKMTTDMSALQKELEKKKKELNAVASPAARAAALKSASENSQSPSKAHTPRGEVAIQKKVEDMRFKLDQKNAEVKKMQNVLQKELGEGVDMKKMLDDNSNWRGRAQQIVMLKTKVKRLENERSAAITSAANPNFKSNRGRSDVDIRAQEDLHDMGEQRREAVEQVTLENQRLSEEAEKITTKFQAAKARTHVLENETKKQVGQMKTLLDKTGMDDELIDALREELENQKVVVRKLKREVQTAQEEAKEVRQRTGQTMGGGMGETSAAEQEQERQRRGAREQAQRIEAQEKLIFHLRDELKDLRDQKTNVSSTAHRGQRPSSQEARSRARQAERLIDAENAVAENKVLTIEKERLSELAGVLREKLADTEVQLEDTTSKCQKMQRQQQSMKKQLGLEGRREGSGAPRGRRPRSSDSGDKDDGITKDTLREELEAMRAENRAIRESFRTSLANSEAELDIVRKMSSEAKEVYDETLQQMREQVNAHQTSASIAAFNLGGAGAGAGGRGAPDSPRGKKMAQLSNDNQHLREELSELVSRYEQLVSKKTRHRQQ
jgi:hypothetical protein